MVSACVTNVRFVLGLLVAYSQVVLVGGVAALPCPSLRECMGGPAELPGVPNPGIEKGPEALAFFTGSLLPLRLSYQPKTASAKPLRASSAAASSAS